MKRSRALLVCSMLAILVSQPAMQGAADGEQSSEYKRVVANGPLQAAETEFNENAVHALELSDFVSAEDFFKKAKSVNSATKWSTQEESNGIYARRMKLNMGLADVYGRTKQQSNEFEVLMEASRDAFASNLKMGYAVELAKRALTVSESLGNQDKLCDALDRCHEALSFDRKNEEAVAILERVLPLRQKHFDLRKFAAAHTGANIQNGGYSGNTEGYLIELSDLAGQYAALHQWNKGTPLWEEYVRIHELALGPEHEMTIDAKYWYCLNLYHVRRFEKARATCEQIIAIHKRLRQNDEMFLLALGLLPEILIDMERYSEAEKIALEELSLAEQRKGSSSRYVASVLETIVEILSLEGKSKAAKQYQARADQIRLLTHTKPKRKLNAKVLVSDGK